eukprot:13017750-Ditylum_brightwellii.AAC.1
MSVSSKVHNDRGVIKPPGSNPGGELLAKGKKLSNEEGKDDLDEVEDDDKDTAINKADFEGLGTGLRL